MKSAEFITELFTNPLPYKWIEKSSTLWSGKFAINSKPPLNVRVDFEYHTNIDLVEIAFLVNGQFKLTGSGHAIEIFSTVTKMVEEYMAQNDPKIIEFAANANEPSRVKLYTRLATSIGQIYQYELLTKQKSSAVYFILKKQ